MTLKIQICQRRFTTLLELLIALGLTVAILTTLTFFYREVSLIDSEVDKVKAEQFKLRYVENRLGDILPKAVSEKTNKKDFVFLLLEDGGLTLPGTQSLIFTYDNGVSLDTPFSNHVLGRLYVDLEGRLTLMYWPSPKRWTSESSVPLKKEVLLENVDALSFTFFVPVGEEQEAEESTETASNPTQGEFTKLPTIIKVKLGIKKTKDQEKEEMSFAFPLPNTQRQVIYQ